ncbi:MAG: hypothetical protein JJT94_10405 [Bernardetiaceae bacterium]|nr:hypothetical protein [Bernardetiaceae bacterium]
MKYLATLIIFVCIVFNALGQSNYKEALQMGDRSFEQGQYKKAINLYFAAEAFEPSQNKTVKDKINKVFDKIEALRAEAEQSKKQAQIAQNDTEKQRQLAEQNLYKAQKLIDAFYFYEDRFALTTSNSYSYYFIDKNGDEMRHLGKWETASIFDTEKGFAKVSNLGVNYLLDTLGNTYETATSIDQINPRVKALRLQGGGLKVFPEEIFDYEQLEILIIGEVNTGSKNQFTQIPPEIAKLKNLKYLIIEEGALQQIPKEIGKLTELKGLYLNSNQISKMPKSITQLNKLQTLMLSNNRFTHFPQEIIGLKNSLLKLDLSLNNLTEIPNDIRTLEHLKSLYLLYNPNLPFKAIDELEEVLPTCEVYSDLNYYDMGFQALDNKDYTLALHSFKKAIRTDSTTIEGYFNAGRVALLLDKPDTALFYLLQGKQRSIFFRHDIHHELIKTYEKLKDYENEYKTAKALINVESNNYITWLYFTRAALTVGQTQEAIEQLEKNITLYTDLHILKLLLATAYTVNNQWDKAENIYKKYDYKQIKDTNESVGVFMNKLIDTLEDRQIKHQDFEKVRKLFTQ